MNFTGKILLVAAMALPALASLAEDSINYVPEIHGALRTRWEMDLDDESSRFQVRNARVTLAGRVSPAIDYFIQTDLCDRGKMKILDAWGRLEFMPGLRLQAGQFRMPFGVDPFRGPANYIFASRSVIGKQVCNVRAVGAKLMYSFAEVPLTLEAGAFNPTSIADHDVWVKTMSYAGKIALKAGDFAFSTGVQTIVPDSVRINLLGAGITWKRGGWTAEAEYMNKHYTHSAHSACHAYNFFVDYGMPVKAGIFNRASVQGRFDGMTAHSNGTRNGEGCLTTTDPARNRITVGGTLTHTYKALHADVRLNYEKFFYHHDVKPTPGNGDRLVAELVVRF